MSFWVLLAVPTIATAVGYAIRLRFVEPDSGVLKERPRFITWPILIALGLAIAEVAAHGIAW